MSPLALRRKYLPRCPPRQPPTPHPTAAAATAADQAQPPQAHSRLKIKTESTTNANRHATLTRFAPGFERDTENEVALAFSRPPRLFKEDSPFYPWLPRPTPIVNFHLNYKF